MSRFGQQLIQEFGEIQSKKFWIRYVQELEKFLITTRNELESASDDRYKQLQGRAFAIKYILALPAKIIETLKAEPND